MQIMRAVVTTACRSAQRAIRRKQNAPARERDLRKEIFRRELAFGEVGFNMSGMNFSGYIPLLLVIVVVVALLGMPLIIASPMHHEMGCPFMSEQAALCVTSILEHIKHWQTAFAAVLFEIFTLCALALFLQRPLLGMLLAPERIRWRAHTDSPARPTLLQELFSRGILNPKVF